MAPNYVKSDLWGSRANIVCITTNGCFKDGSLLMGAGAAGQAKERFPLLPKFAAQEIIRHHAYRVEEGRKAYYLYGFQMLPYDRQVFGEKSPFELLGLFQTKGLVSLDSTLALIGYSTMMLAMAAKKFTGKQFALNFPGIGHGKLESSAVAPVLAVLPENVTIYYQ